MLPIFNGSATAIQYAKASRAEDIRRASASRAAHEIRRQATAATPAARRFHRLTHAPFARFG